MMEQCKEKLNIAMFGQKRIPSREGGVEIVVEELCTRMVAQGHNVTCYNRGGHHVSGSEYDSKRLKEYKGIRLPTNMTHHFSCGVEAAKCYFGQKVVDENDYVLIPNAIDVERFIYNPEIRNKIRKENDLENKHVVGHVGRFMAQKNHTFLVDIFAEVLKIDSQAHLVLLGDGELMDEIKRKAADLLWWRN